MLLPPPCATLFPYTTLFRSGARGFPMATAVARAPERVRGEVEELRVERREQHRLRAHHAVALRSEEHTSELQSLRHLVCRLLLEKKKTNILGRASRQVTCER